MSDNECGSTSPGKRKLTVDDDKDKAYVDETNKRRKSEDAQPSTSVDIVVVKKEKVDEVNEVEPLREAEHSSNSHDNNIPVAIKAEQVEEFESATIHSTSSASEPSTSSNVAPVNAVAKTEPTNDVAAVDVKTEPSASTRQAPAADSSVSSSTMRPSCRFGIRCYR